eukprot:13351256-Alexandrium_andersonii.AAC.1
MQGDGERANLARSHQIALDRAGGSGGGGGGRDVSSQGNTRVHLKQAHLRAWGRACLVKATCVKIART